jgi:uncharacterized protein
VLLFESVAGRSILLRITILLLIAYVGLCLLLFMAQHRLIYFPSQENLPLPDGFQQWTSPDAKISWGYKRIRGARECLFFFHGNGGNASGWSHAVAGFPGDIFVLEYPGYGGRPGRPSENSIKAAAREVFAAEHQRYARVIVAGQSLGAAVTEAIFSSWPQQIHTLVLVTPFLSLRDMARNQFWFVPTTWILRDTFELFEPWQNFPGKSHVVIARADEVVPRSHSLRYVATTNKNVAVLEISGASHNSIELDREFWNRILN